jgi:hypothetical protein
VTCVDKKSHNVLDIIAKDFGVFNSLILGIFGRGKLCFTAR